MTLRNLILALLVASLGFNSQGQVQTSGIDPACDQDQIFTITETIPVFNGTYAQAYKMLNSSTNKVELASSDNNLVIMKMVVDCKGKISNIEVPNAEKVSAALVTEAILVTRKLSGYMRPGMQQGVAVNSKFLFTMRYRNYKWKPTISVAVEEALVEELSIEDMPPPPPPPPPPSSVDFEAKEVPSDEEYFRELYGIPDSVELEIVEDDELEEETFDDEIVFEDIEIDDAVEVVEEPAWEEATEVAEPVWEEEELVVDEVWDAVEEAEPEIEVDYSEPHFDYERPRKLYIYRPEFRGLPKEEVYPIGWSDDSRYFAYMSMPNDRNCECFFAEFRIVNLLTNKVEWFYHYSNEDYVHQGKRGWSERFYSLYNLWSNKRRGFEEALRKYQIRQPGDVEYSKRTPEHLMINTGATEPEPPFLSAYSVSVADKDEFASIKGDAFTTIFKRENASKQRIIEVMVIGTVSSDRWGTHKALVLAKTYGDAEGNPLDIGYEFVTVPDPKKP